MKTVNIREENFTAVHVLMEDALFGEQPVLRVVKKDKINIYDENTYAKVDGLQFHNGIIEVKLLSRLLPDAPDFARGFKNVYESRKAGEIYLLPSCCFRFSQVSSSS